MDDIRKTKGKTKYCDAGGGEGGGVYIVNKMRTRTNPHNTL